MQLYVDALSKKICSFIIDFVQVKNKFEILETSPSESVLAGVERPIIQKSVESIPYILSGWSTVIREIVLAGQQNQQYLLGYKGYALKCVAEASPRTNLVDNMLPKINKSEKDLEQALIQLEQILATPATIYNRDKLQRILLHRRIEKISDINARRHAKKKETRSPELPLLLRAFTEGALFSILDLICIAFLENCDINSADFPFCSRWQRLCLKITKNKDILASDPPVECEDNEYRVIQEADQYQLETSEKVKSVKNDLLTTTGTLGKRKLNREDGENLTVKRDLTEVIEKIKKIDKLENFTRIKSTQHTRIWAEEWNSIHEKMHPSSGELSGKRLSNKLGQLQSMFTHLCDMIETSKKKQVTLVDFCAGGGHQSLPLAAIFPQKLNVVILENKQQSLERGAVRAGLAGLKNVICLQSNLENFKSPFDIGIGLHACGPATDLILKKCLKARSSFLVVPCCYGRIATLAEASDTISQHKFPKSDLLKTLPMTREEYCLITRCADMDQDQKRAQDARLSMKIVDWDRMYAMQESISSYKLALHVIEPPDCATKNHILIGRV